MGYWIEIQGNNMADFLDFIDDPKPPKQHRVHLILRNSRPRNSFTTGFGAAYGCLLGIFLFVITIIVGCILLEDVVHNSKYPVGVSSSKSESTDR